MTKKEKLAKAIRTITVPPVQVCVFLFLFYFIRDDVVETVWELILSLVFLMLIPILAYPIAAVVPRLHKQGREGQRKLAFILSPVGYFAAVLYGLFAGVGQNLMLIYMTYMLSVIVLIVFNKLGVRASGHACSIAGPLVVAIYFIGWKSFLPCAALFAVIIWSSLALKRHTPTELFWGSISSILAFAASLAIMSAV